HNKSRKNCTSYNRPNHANFNALSHLIQPLFLSNGWGVPQRTIPTTYIIKNNEIYFWHMGKYEWNSKEINDLITFLSKRIISQR
ncbi:MAG: hypothetical protein AAGG68_27245, partial [Bacteroidota bacterium]